MIGEGDCGAIGGMKIGKGNRSTWRKPAPVPLCPPQITLDQTQDWTRATAVESQRLTAWAMAWPIMKLSMYIMPPETIAMAYLKVPAVSNANTETSQTLDIITLILLEYLSWRLWNLVCILFYWLIYAYKIMFCCCHIRHLVFTERKVGC
jgi:hypothetical protein